MNDSSSHTGSGGIGKSDKEEIKSPSTDTIKSTLMFSQHFRVSIAVALITVSMIGLLALLGYGIDRLLDTKPAFTLVGVVVSFPLSQFAIYKWVKNKYVPRIKKKSL